MAQDFNGRARARAWAAGIDAARRRVGIVLPDWAAPHAAKLQDYFRTWVAAELSAGRLVPWLPVAFCLGIALYFTASREPLWWAALGLALGGVAIAVASRRSVIGFPLALAATAIVAGLAVAAGKAALIAHPVLAFPVSGVSVTGFVEIREEREKSDRIVVRVHGMEGARLTTPLQRVRVAVRKGTAPAVGQFVEFKARLTPPLAPLRPGGYDFARDMYFQRIGASGYALGAIKTVSPPVPAGLRLRYAAFVDGVREAIDDRIRASLPGDRGSIASALITGKRDAISTTVNDAMYVSSLAHVLSISGYHMAVVAGIVFFVIRAGLALSPSLSGRRPIKKWAALAALFAAALYLLLSGAEVATQRSFIMIAIVLIGVVMDRPALTFRTLTVAVFGVLSLAPESLVHPSFQMSFAATLALIAAYQYGLPWRAGADFIDPGEGCAVGRPRDRRTYVGVICGGPRDNALRGLSLSPACALWRARQPVCDASRLRLGDADGNSGGASAAVRVRCTALEVYGRRYRLDDRGRVVGVEPSGCSRANGRLWNRAAAAGDGRTDRDLLVAHTAAMERRRCSARRLLMGNDHAKTGRLGRCRRAGRSRSRRRW